MKKILILSIASISLFARLNPFEPVVVKQIDTNETKTIKLQPIQAILPLYSTDDGKRSVKIMSEDRSMKSKPIAMDKDEIVVKKFTKKEIAEQCKLIETSIPKVAIIKLPKIVKKPKPFEPTVYNVLPFLTIDVKKNSISIETRKKYKLIRYYLEKKPKKFVFDFQGKVLTYTKFKNINAPHFSSYMVGNHPEADYFRVVISVKEKMSKFKVVIKNNIATINYKK
ncbi:MAG TPA: AMIN domain-containing protein [Arcobacter sp.]|nr:AMIN domain-containing protein [Arcobacter sp.]HIP55509.1 AMIN domain-containing protein [Arcobacter sp.]